MKDIPRPTVWCARCGDAARNPDIGEDERWAAEHRCGIYGLLSDIGRRICRIPPMITWVGVLLVVWAVAIGTAIMIGGR